MYFFLVMEGNGSSKCLVFFNVSKYNMITKNCIFKMEIMLFEIIFKNLSFETISNMRNIEIFMKDIVIAHPLCFVLCFTTMAFLPEGKSKQKLHNSFGAITINDARQISHK